MAPSLPEVPRVQHSYVDAGGLRTHVAQAGEGDPLLLVHGWPQHWYTWRRVIEPLSRRFRVICPDLRGLGWTATPADGYEKESLASDLLALLDTLELERVQLVGHDWGGFASFLLALRAPERVSRLLALGIAHPWMALSPRGALTLHRLWYQVVLASPRAGAAVLERRPDVFRAVLTRAAGDPDLFSEADLEAYASVLSEPARARASQAYYRTFLTRELLPILRGRYAEQRLRVPTRLVVGDRDPVITPQILSGFEDHADAMELELVPGAGHFLPEQVPDLVVARILAAAEG